jgi:hypothetical protein
MLEIDDPGFIQGFDWGLYPEVEGFVEGEIGRFLTKHGLAKELSGRMADEASTRFIDWIDHMVLPEERVSAKKLERLGYSQVYTKEMPDGASLFKQTKTEFFPILISGRKTTEIALKPESIDHFLQMLGRGTPVEGAAYSPFRRAEIKREGDFLLSAVERRGGGGYLVREEDGEDVPEYLRTLSVFSGRKRFFETDGEGLEETGKLAESSLKRLDRARVSDAFFRSERTYWQRRNRAGQIQKARQDRLGLGWGNHDHHTYRSSRENFADLIRIFEKMGYICREKFYAGAEARWGAQILEHPICDIVVFADVDLFPEETEIDFPHRGLKHRADLGTVGLWIGLHGESILQAGMHHLEARFDFEKLRNDLPDFGVSVMKPFSDFPFLKQAFTTGEIWHVERKRLERLLKDGSITKEQYDGFVEKGAIGSHLENLQRNQGFKGFNQKSVTAIIKATDPRTYKVEHA